MPEPPYLASFEDVVRAATRRPWHLPTAVDVAGGPEGPLAYVSVARARGRTMEEAHANALLVMWSVNAAWAIAEVLAEVRRALVMRTEWTDETAARLVERIDAALDADLNPNRQGDS